GSEADEKELKKQTGSTPRCIKEEIKGKDVKCFFTKKKATHYVYFARAY
ncbi:MAG: proline--tRNA ligase, partial [Malacoplasma sp.]|nr:proline--tRNA ligase [Malacoplasma sp.]